MVFLWESWAEHGQTKGRMACEAGVTWQTVTNAQSGTLAMETDGQPVLSPHDLGKSWTERTWEVSGRSQVWWHTCKPSTPEARAGDLTFNISLSYIVRPCLKIERTNKVLFLCSEMYHIYPGNNPNIYTEDCIPLTKLWNTELKVLEEILWYVQ
jgi:hypothetical protein